jgi:hypothetical protein
MQTALTTEIPADIQHTVTKTIAAVREVGLNEIWVSIESELSEKFKLWVETLSYSVEPRVWAGAQSIYVGTNNSNGCLRVFSIKF